jgi:hypothetical protein
VSHVDPRNAVGVPSARLSAWTTLMLDLGLATGAIDAVKISRFREPQLTELARVIGIHLLDGLDADAAIKRAREV